jgi:hypothetical protein
MLTIVPSRSQVSDRFPIASFDVAVPQRHYFEVVCATDPRLFHSDWQRHRSATNFHTSRARGLVHAPDGRSAYFLPPEQLRRFAGAPRIYYALASYGSVQGADPRFSISPDALERLPGISLAGDFPGRTLDRARLLRQEPAPDLYGGVSADALRWGGDDVLDSERRSRTEQPAAGEYDDGLASHIWRSHDAGGDHRIADDSLTQSTNIGPLTGRLGNIAAVACITLLLWGCAVDSPLSLVAGDSGGNTTGDCVVGPCRELDDDEFNALENALGWIKTGGACHDMAREAMYSLYGGEWFVDEGMENVAGHHRSHGEHHYLVKDGILAGADPREVARHVLLHETWHHFNGGEGEPDDAELEACLEPY